MNPAMVSRFGAVATIGPDLYIVPNRINDDDGRLLFNNGDCFCFQLLFIFVFVLQMKKKISFFIHHLLGIDAITSLQIRYSGHYASYPVFHYTRFIGRFKAYIKLRFFIKVSCVGTDSIPSLIGQRTHVNTLLPFSHLDIW